ncbi:hypothetical protein [Streptacidiphilus cavernicola]|uniref:Uncharacterized protein n=1 Tax=Streptacidiphilus cavernicola TaxID=3342716 RepID=A0ABV6VVZ9_9ACTN
MSEQPLAEQAAVAATPPPAAATPPAAQEAQATAPAAAQPDPETPATTPPAAPAPYDPANTWAVPAQLIPPPASRRPRTWVRTALRWTVATVVCAAVGVGTAVAVTTPRRTDIPGLKTPADSRYTFPRLALPALPPKAITPSQGQNTTGHPDHAADLRKLLLPAPVGATSDKSVALDPSGWYPTASYLKAMGNNTQLGAELNEYGIRHITARAWTGADGVRTQIYLLGFRDDNSASFVYLDDLANTRPVVATGLDTDPSVDISGLTYNNQLTTLSQKAAKGRPAVRMAYLNIGDIEAVIVMSSPKAVPELNFRQVLTLQAELLQG